MNQWLIAIVFCLVLFIYIHIQHQYTTSDDLEVYRVSPKTKEDIEDVMDLKQPAVFTFDSPELVDELSLPSLEDKYGSYDVTVGNASMRRSLSKLLEQYRGGDTSAVGGITMRNQEFLYETELVKRVAENDHSLRPPLMSGSVVDIWVGMRNVTTPLVYHTQYRNFILNTFGAIEVVMIPPKYGKYMTSVADYDNLEYIASVNPWTIPNDSKIKTVHTQLAAGQVLYVPPYWFYSVRFISISSVCRISYTTYINVLANIYDIVIQKYRQLRYRVEKFRRGDVATQPPEIAELVPIMTEKQQLLPEMPSELPPAAQFLGGGVENTLTKLEPQQPPQPPTMLSTQVVDVTSQPMRTDPSHQENINMTVITATPSTEISQPVIPISL